MLEETECVNHCKSIEHGKLICSVLTKRCVSDLDLCAYLQHICCSCENVKDEMGRTALHVAASCGRTGVVKWLIQAKHANINVKDDESGYTPLHRSLIYGKIDIAVHLIKSGANINLTDHNNLTSLENVMMDCPMQRNQCELSGTEVYMWGSNANYVLGPQQARLVPELLDTFHKEYPNLCIQHVCLEKFHCILMTTDGSLFVSGHGQGGRLGLSSENTFMSPQLIKFDTENCGNPVVCKRVAIGLDHSVLLTESKQVWTFGLNTHRVLGLQPPPTHVLTPTPLPLLPHPVEDVCAARYHTVAWGPNAIYTWGLHGGQLGHDKSSQKHIVTPRLVTYFSGSGVNITAVDASNGATAVLLSTGNVYVLHQYQCRRIASRLAAMRSIRVIGGQLSDQLDNSVSSEEKHELKVIGLTVFHDLYIWQESDPQFLRCTFSINRCLSISQIALNVNEILFITHDGEAFQGILKPRKKKTIIENNDRIKKSDFSVFLEKTDSHFVKVKKIPRVHRATYICSDLDGKNYAILQSSPNTYVTKLPKTSKPVILEDMLLLLNESCDDDAIHDVIFKVSYRLFPAHRYVIASSDSMLSRLIASSTDTIIELSNVHEEIFEQVLLFIYTGTCDILKLGKCPKKLQDLYDRNKENHILENNKDLDQKNAIDDRCTKKTPRDPVQLMQEAAKRFGSKLLRERLRDIYYCDGCIQKRKDACASSKLKFSRMAFPELYDVVLKSKEGKTMNAHRCILAARLEYFNNLFSSRWSDVSSNREISLPFSYNVVVTLLDFLYTDELPSLDNDDIDQVCNLLIISDQLFVLRLKELCECTLSSFVTLRNVAQLLSFSSLYNAPQLQVYCMQFICLNLPAVLESRCLESINEDLLLELSNFYCNCNSFMDRRIITPYSYAPPDEVVLEASNLHHISLDSIINQESKVTNVRSQKKRSRPKKISLSDGNNKTKSQGVSNESINDSRESFDLNNSEILKEDVLNMSTKGTANSDKIQMQVKAILNAQDKVNCDNLHDNFTKLPLSGISISPSDFPELNNIRHSSGLLSKSPSKTEKCEMKQKFTKLSQKQRKRLSSESNANLGEACNSTVSESPKNPWKIPVNVCSPVGSPQEVASMNSIITDEKKQKENLVKMRSKSLVHTQMEDKAIEDLYKFYNADNIFDEIICVVRIEIGSVASPVWVHK